MELQQLEHFLAVAKNLHFTRTAELLSISQSALSRSIANLEADLGILLIEREGRSVRLNRYGEQFAKGVERVLREIEAAKEELLLAQSPDCGTVALSFLKSLGISAVPKIISQYHAAHPQVQFQLYQESTQVMLDQLERGEVDLVLSSMTETRGTLHWVSLWEERIYAYVPESHQLAEQAEVEIRELAEQPFISMKKGYGLRTITDRLFEQSGVQPRILFEGDEVVTAAGLVGAGLGVSLLPDLSAWIPVKAVRIAVSEPDCQRQIGLAWRKDFRLSPAAQRFRAFLLNLFGRKYEQEEMSER